MEDGGDDAAVGLNGYGSPHSGLVEGGHEDGANPQDDVGDNGCYGGACDVAEPGDDGAPDGGDEDGGGDDDGDGDESNAHSEPGHDAVDGIVVGCNVGGVLSLTTVISLNASVLIESSGCRFRDFAKYVKGLEQEAPDLIAVTELGGYSGWNDADR